MAETGPLPVLTRLAGFTVLPLLSVGAVGSISVVGHLLGGRIAQMIRVFRAVDVADQAIAHGQIHLEVVGVDGPFCAGGVFAE